MGWKVGTCSLCANEKPNRQQLQTKVFKLAIEKQTFKQKMEDRRKTLGKGLAKLLDQSDYDPEKHTRVIKPDEPLGIKMVLKFILHKVQEKISLSDADKRKKSPLVRSTIRKTNVHKVHILGQTLPNPSVIIQAPQERLTIVAENLAQKLVSQAQPSPSELSPLLRSNERKSTISLADKVEGFRERAVSKVAPAATRTAQHLPPALRKPATFFQSNGKQSTHIQLNVDKTTSPSPNIDQKLLHSFKNTKEDEGERDED